MKYLPNLTFLKCGGSLITDKTQPLTARESLIARIAQEIATSKSQVQGQPLLIGHGSGSFGHAIASQYQTQNGVNGPLAWRGFAEVWAAARALDQIVIEQFAKAGLPVMAFPPSAGLLADGQRPVGWDVQPLKLALAHGLIPVVYGDVIFDRTLGGTIFSTEKVFQYLAQALLPTRILLAGADTGVYANPEEPDKVIERITPATFAEIRPLLSGSEATDVTGGMLAKVEDMLALVAALPALEIQIFSGMAEGNIQRALAGDYLGTCISF